jgi:Fe-S cluster assembly protein SufD
MDLDVLPNRRVEAWKYSDLRAALSNTPLPNEASRPLRAKAALDGPIERLAVALGRHDCTEIAPGASELLVERLGLGELDASVREVAILPGGSLTRVVIQASADNVVLNALHVSLGEGARFRQIVLAEGARLARIETHVAIEGEGAQVELNGAYMCNSARHADLTSVIEHKVANGETRQLVKGVARKGGRGVFQGKIVVEHGAQKTDARQYHHGLLLEEGAEIYAKPELLIHADDVECAHGNTAGGLDETALFYLRSRGVAEAHARALLIEAFLAETLPAGLPEIVHEELVSRIGHWLWEERQ